MSVPFARSARSLAGDIGRRSLARVLLVVTLLAAWLAWLLFAKVELLAMTDQARLEVVGLIQPGETPIAGKVAASHLLLGRDVNEGDVLVDLDAQEQRLLPCVRVRATREAKRARQHVVGNRRRR
jgi:membrane fusion protein (multidrug efflux system)